MTPELTLRCNLCPHPKAKVRVSVTQAQMDAMTEAMDMVKSSDPDVERGGWALYWALVEELDVRCHIHEEVIA